MEICGIRAVCSKPTPKCMKLSSPLTLGTEKLFKILLLHTWVGGDAQDLLDSPNYGLLFSFHGGMDPQRVTGATSLLRQGHPRAQDSVRCFWNIPREETPQPLCLGLGPALPLPPKPSPTVPLISLLLIYFITRSWYFSRKEKHLSSWWLRQTPNSHFYEMYLRKLPGFLLKGSTSIFPLSTCL